MVSRGVHAMLIYDTLYEHREINYIGVRHEQAATYMADGYARSTGRVGVCLTTTAAMAEAYSSSSPVLQICTQTQSSLLNRGKGALHEAKDQLGLFRAVTGWNKRFMMGCQELATAVQHQINPPVLIFNNQGYGVLRETQDIEFSGRRIGVDLFSPDFIKFAEAFGTEGVRVARLEELAPAINKALQAQKPTLIEVVGPLIEPLS